MNITRRIALGAIVAALSAVAYAQQITKFGVVDTAKVYNAYFKNSAAVRGYEKKKAEAAAEITRRTEEIRSLRERQASLPSDSTDSEDADGGRAGGFSFSSPIARKSSSSSKNTLDDEIARKTKELTDYAASKNRELDAMQKSMQGSDAFYKKLYAVIAKVAEQGGYSAILSLQQSGGVLWYSPSVDVTEDVIRALEK